LSSNSFIQSLLANRQAGKDIPKPVWAVGFVHEQTLHVVAIPVFSFLILKRLQHKAYG
jgi:hypothetical protein